MAYHRRRRFGTRSRTAVTSSTLTLGTRTDKRTGREKHFKCKACKARLMPGDNVIRLRLKKIYQQPCLTCGHKPTKLKYFHVACAPQDINKAMGFDLNAANAAAQNAALGGNMPDPGRHAHQVAPPPKPQTALDAVMSALVGVENALKRRIAENPALQRDVELAALLKTYNGCKARFLRPGTDKEGDVAMKMTLKKCIDIVF